MKKALLVFGIAFIIAVLLAGGGYLWFRSALQSALPQTAGEIEVPGLAVDVEIIRDRYGVAHVFASNEEDLYLGFGYAMAQDRFWQMEFLRRLGAGRLSEVFGEDFVEVDRHFRMLTAGSPSPDIPEEVAFTFRSFGDGVNAYLKSHADRLPFEFRLLRYEPEPWKTEDIFAILKVINRGLSAGWQVDLVAAEVLERVGEERMREAFPADPEDAPMIVPEGIKGESFLPAGLAGKIALSDAMPSLFSQGASNNWVVSSRKSLTGKPLLANDPHLDLSNPSIWWEGHLSCPGVNVSGFAIAGVPGFPIGHNDFVAWGVTNAMVDDVDFYVEKLNPVNPRQYLYKDRWEEMKVIEEMIGVKGKEPLRAEILVTRHGPVLSDGGTGESTIAARWAYRERPQPVKAAYLLMKARNVKEVVESLSSWDLPSQNFVFADLEGNIGHWYCAAMPIRARGDGLLPVPGWEGRYEWEGYVPFGEKPHVLNPEEGFIATANNRVVGDRYPHPVSHYWEPIDRVSRIRQMIGSREKLSSDDFMKMQGDVHCLLAAELVPHIVRVLTTRFSDELSRNARDLLAGWNFAMDKESVPACIFEVTYRKLMDCVFMDELGEPLLRRYLHIASFPPRAIRGMMRKGNSAWFDDVGTSEKEGMDEVLAESLGRAFSELNERVGSDMRRWTWGRIHTLTFEHALARKWPLHLVFNLGPHPVSGSALTVDKKQYDYAKPYQANHGVSSRMIVDFSNLKRALHLLPTGESGHLASPHHRDQVPLYLNGRYRTAWLDRADVEANMEEKLLLKQPR